MSEKKIEGLFVPNIKMPESCAECHVKRYNIRSGDLFCVPLNRKVGNCVFDDDNTFVGDICIRRHEDCPIRECFQMQRL